MRLKTFLWPAVAVLAMVMLWKLDRRQTPSTGPTSHSAGIAIEKIRELSALTTLTVSVADALVTELQGNTGSTKAVLIVKGDVSLGVDLSAAKFESVDAEHKRAVVALPRPTVQFVRLDQEKTRLLGVYNSGLWAITPGGGNTETATINACYRDAQRTVAQVASDPALIARTRRQAELVLKSFVAATGWDLSIIWQE